MLKRHVTKRGSVRLRISVVWNEDRTRLAHYPKLLPTFIVPLVDGKAKYATMFATQGRYANPYRFKTSVFKAHATDLKRAIADATAKLCDFFFWRWPFLSIFVGIVWQLLVSYPTFFPVIVPFTGLGALVRGYFDLPAKPRSLETKLSFSQLLVILLCNHREPPLRAQAAASVDEEEANSEGDSDSDEDEDDSKRLKKTRSANAPSAASAAARKRRPPNWMPDVDSVRDVLPTFIPDPGSLQEAQDQVFWETEQEIRAEFVRPPAPINPRSTHQSSVSASACAPDPEIARDRVSSPCSVTLASPSTHSRPSSGQCRQCCTTSTSKCASCGECSRGTTAYSHSRCVHLPRSAPPPASQASSQAFSSLFSILLSPSRAFFHTIALPCQLCLALVAMSIVFILLGVAFTYVPWAAVAEWTFRILGLALFGPHMRWVGRSVRGRWADYVRQSDEYEDGDAETRKRMLEEHKVWCEATIGEMVQREVHGTLPDPDVLELEAALAKKYRTVVVNPRPIAAKLRYVHRPDFTRSVAYPMPPMLASRSDTHRGFATVAYQA